MRFLRFSIYNDLEHRPLTVVTAEEDLEEPLEQTIENLIEEPSRKSGAFVAYEVFELPDGASIPEAAAKAHKLYLEKAQTEYHMAMLYFYDADSLEKCNPNGIVTGSVPAPLTTDQIAYVFKMLTKHPNYKQQTLIAISRDLQFVKLHRGEITTERIR